ncbi:hypothetical protein DL96DRAFT_1666368 [Flagelloscypha sp. PMI_526]|nr:hypothetical protein DL96DRAFT_1666368 [Flagelloscypha sp. PMI_526]
MLWRLQQTTELCLSYTSIGMPPPKAKENRSGLGRAIINRKVQDARRQIETGNYSTDLDSTSKLKSVTQERDLDEFFNTAQLAETDFTAERRNVKIIPQNAAPSHNPYLLDEAEEKSTLLKHEENKGKLRVPRRPPWIKKMTTVELDRQEKAAFLDWRRGLAQLQDNDHLLLTPFERNLEVWRQLWRVLERSHLVVQIVDARNPLNFRCEDLEKYVLDIEGAGKRKNLLLINKADLLTVKQRIQWADYFEEQHIQYAFFSAANASAIQEARKEAAEALARAAEAKQTPETTEETVGDDGPVDSEDESDSDDGSDATEEDAFYSADEDEEEDDSDPRAHVLSVVELEDLFQATAPPLTNFASGAGQAPSQLVVGLVGYPNVGKSSTINALLGEKKVSVSSTPGKTKHFQTLHLSDAIILCDCPGLVFPQFATTKAELVCNGVLPIDQMREYSGPTSLVVKRIPTPVLAAIYGLTIPIKSVEDGGSGTATAQDLLIPYAVARGYMRAGQGNPDEARASRYILKDYVNAKLLYCHPPPGKSDSEFNEETHARRGGNEFSRSKLLPHQNSVADDGTVLTGRRARLTAVLAAAERGGVGSGKKNHKKPKRTKQRSGKGYD